MQQIQHGYDLDMVFGQNIEIGVSCEWWQFDIYIHIKNHLIIGSCYKVKSLLVNEFWGSSFRIKVVTKGFKMNLWQYIPSFWSEMHQPYCIVSDVFDRNNCLCIYCNLRWLLKWFAKNSMNQVSSLKLEAVPCCSLLT